MQIYQFQYLALGLYLLLVPVLILLAWYVGRRIVRPISLLSRASRRIENGEWGVTVPMRGGDELGGERLVFTDLDVGATVKVAEENYGDDFIQTAVFNDTGATYNPTTATDYTVAETASELQVTNESKNDTTPTGILIANLPYIVLALVAIGGLVAYVVVRRRNADEA